MKNKLVINGKEIEISQETANSIEEQLSSTLEPLSYIRPKNKEVSRAGNVTDYKEDLYLIKETCDLKIYHNWRNDFIFVHWKELK